MRTDTVIGSARVPGLPAVGTRVRLADGRTGQVASGYGPPEHPVCVDVDGDEINLIYRRASDLVVE